MKHKSIITAMMMAQLTLGGLSYSNLVEAQQTNTASLLTVEKGQNNGRMLRQDGFAIELAIFEDGIDPQFHAYPSMNSTAIAASEVAINVKLTRLGNVIDDINFDPNGDYSIGDMTIYEPHSFVVTLTAQYQGKSYQWSYDNFEGRVSIDQDVAKSMKITTDVVSSQQMVEQLKVYGQLQLAPNASRDISARFSGQIKHLSVALGQRVKKGQLLMKIESNESLQTYAVYSPIDGIVTAQNARVGEQTRDRTLLTLANPSQLIAHFWVYPRERDKVKLGAAVRIAAVDADNGIETTLFDALPQVTAHQGKTYRAMIDNSDGRFSIGQFVTGNILVSAYQVPLAVNANALQAFRDFTVVYAKVGQQYEVRMLTLGRRAGGFVEVLGGIAQGTEYVANNSYVVKADIGKSGASHDH